ncbi:MAG: LysR family transcriptional regulator [Myxococcales bacterium]|nr:LysR family transcriptional regulator [Myxococcales bacterium]
MEAELGHLRHFFEVARQGGFTRAAVVLRAQQPGMSRSVRLLEERLGVTLIDRKGRRFALTSAGERVYAACARIFSEVEQIGRIAEEERGTLSGPVRIGASGVLASRVVPDAVAGLLAVHPRLWPMIYSAPAAMGMAKIASGELELGLYLYLPEVPSTLSSVALVEVPFRLVVRADRAKDEATLTSFLGSREVEDPRATGFPTLDKLRKRYPAAAIRVSSNDAEAHLRMVEAGLGVSVLPELLVAEGLRAGTLVDVLRGERFQFPVLLVTRRGHTLTGGAQALIGQVIAQVTSKRPKPR